MKAKWLAYFQLTLAMFLAGSSVVAGKIIINSLPIFASQSIILAISIIFLLPAAIIAEGNVFKARISPKDMLYMFFQALSGIFLFRLFIMYGLKFTTASNSGIITSSGPAVLVVLSFFLLKEKISKTIMLGISLSFMGILLTNMGKSSDTAAGALQILWGNGLVLLAVVSESLFTIFRKKMSYRDKPLTSTLIVIVFAFIMFLPLALYEGLTRGEALEITFNNMLPLFYYGIFCTVIAYYFWFSGISKVSVSVAAGFTAVMPISSITLSFFILSETPLWQHFAGISLAVAGICIISGKKNMV